MAWHVLLEKRALSQLSPGRPGGDFECLNFKHKIYWYLEYSTKLDHLIDEKSTLVQAMAWSHQAPQAITWANVDPDLFCHMASPACNELNRNRDPHTNEIFTWNMPFSCVTEGKDWYTKSRQASGSTYDLLTLYMLKFPETTKIYLHFLWFLLMNNR